MGTRESDLFTTKELMESLYSKTKAIINKVSEAKEKIDVTRTTWSEKRGDLYSIIRLLNDMSNFLVMIGSWDRKLSGLPIDTTELVDSNKEWVHQLDILASKPIYERITGLNVGIATDILTLYNRIWSKYNQLLPLVGKFMDDQLGFPLSRISDSLTEYKQLFSGNWATAAIHLAMMDSVVNKVREQLGLVKDVEKDARDPFQKRYSDLRNSLRSEGIDLDPSVTGKAMTLWSLRTGVLHYGMDPSDEDMALVMRWVKEVIDNLVKVSDDYLKSKMVKS